MTHAETRRFFESLDWVKNDAALALETGHYRSTILRWRRKLGIEKSPHFHEHKQHKEHSNRRPLLIMAPSLKKIELARLIGVTRQRIDQLIHPQKHKTRCVTHYAIKKGWLVRPNACSGCQSVGMIHAHHPDYSNARNVEWLCPKCHRQAHNTLSNA